MSEEERGRASWRPEAAESAAGFRRPPRAVDAARLTLDSARQEKSLENLGRMLKTKREINGLTRRDVTVKIKIPLDQLEAIEEGRLSVLPPVFAKGFLRAYANELGLDAEAILDDYRKMAGVSKEQREVLAPRYEETRVASPSWRPGRRALAAVIVLAAGSFGLWPEFRRTVLSLWPAGGSRPPEEAAAASEAAPPPPGRLEETVEVAVVSGRLAAPLPSAPPAAASAAAGGGELVLVSQKDGVWVQISTDGRPVEHFWLKRGQKVTRRAESSIRVRTGQAAALTAFWNGSELGRLSDEPVVELNFPPS